MSGALELDDGISLLLELLLVPSELDEAISPLLELSSVGGADGDSEQAKTAREIAVANVGKVILIMVSPWLVF
jgi:hypothetical protein